MPATSSYISYKRGCGTIAFLRNPDPEKERSEKRLTLSDFLNIYNKDLPEQFPLASISLLKKFQEASPKLFKDGNFWTLGAHRRQFMDWLQQHVRALQLTRQK